MKKLFIFLLITGIFYGCHSKDPYVKSRQIYVQTMDIHDEVMPKMGEVLGIKHALKQHLDSISDLELKANINSAMSDLDSTYKDMMDWMAKIQPVPDPKENNGSKVTINSEEVSSPEEMINIQDESLKKIKEIKAQMEIRLQKGKDLLEKK